MRKVIVFNFVTLGGYFEGPKRDISWHKHAAGENEYAVEMLDSGDTFLFGRVTHELMASYWPPDAIKNDPIVAEGMNSADKIVFSRTLKKVEWNTVQQRNHPSRALLNKIWGGTLDPDRLHDRNWRRV